LLALLKKLNLDKKTVVIFSSDNGPHREGGHRPDLFNSSGPFRGGKLHLTEGGLRVPMLVRWPGKINPGTVSDHISAFQDFLPTACDLAGLPTPKGLDGVSFLPTLLGENDAQKQHDYLYWEFVLIGGATAVRQGKWKAMQNGLHKNPDAPVKLYNLEKDIREENDVAAENPKVVKKMLQIMRQARTPSRPFWLYETDRRKTTTGSPLQ